MKTEVSIIDQITRELVVTIDAETYKKDYQVALKKFSQKVQIDGFRKGKAPASLIERLYGANVKEFYIEEFGNKYYKTALDETKSEPIDAGALNDIIFEETGEVVMKFQFECMPVDFEYDIKDLEIQYEAVEFQDEMLDSAINEILKENAELVPLDENDEIQLDNTISILEIETNQEINDIIVNDNDKFLIQKNIQTDTLIGLKINSDFETGEIKYKIVDAFKKIIPELTEEIAKTLGYDNIDEMKASIKEELIKDIDNKNKNNFSFALINSYGQKNKDNIKLPQSFMIRAGQHAVRQQIGNMNGNKDIPELGDDFYLKIAEYQLPNLLWDVSYEKIAKDNNIEVSETELDEKINSLAEQFKLSSEEFKTKYSNNLSYLKDDMLVERVIEFIKPMCTIVKPKIQETDQESEVIQSEDAEFEVISDNNEE